MRIFRNKNIEIRFDARLAECVERSVANFAKGIDFVQDLFGYEIKETEKIKASFFVDRKEFVEHIKTLDKNANVPEWATGCFYGGESQILIDPADEEDVNRRKYTLLHEAIHLVIQKSIYEKYRVDRIVWFDEAFAGFLDGHIENLAQKELEDIAKRLEPIAENFDMNKLNDFSLVKTQEYDGYDMFLIIGKYMVQSGVAKTFIETIKRNSGKILEEGKKILQKAISFIIKA